MPRSLPIFALALLLFGCPGSEQRPAPPAPVVRPPPPEAPIRLPPPKVGLALGGGAAKGFAHIGVIKMLLANGIRPAVVSGTSAGSVVGALYAGGMDVYQLQRHAVALDESRIRDVSLFSRGLVKGEALQDYVNEMVGNRPFDKLALPFAAVATRLDNGARVVFVRGNVGQAVRASSSLPGVFAPATIGEIDYVDGGLVSPVPVDAARQLGADFVVAVDISSRASGSNPDSLGGVIDQSIAILGQRAGAEERGRADVLIRPAIDRIGAADFEARAEAILEGERAAVTALPQLRAKLAALQERRVRAERERRRAQPRAQQRAQRPARAAAGAPSRS